MSQVFNNSKKTIARQIISILIQLISLTIVARGLGVEGNGQYAMAILLPIMLGTFLSLGLNSANIYFIGRNEYPLDVIYTTTLILYFIVVLIGLLAGYLLITYYANSLFSNVSIEVLSISLFIFPLTLLFQFLLSFIQAKENFTTYNIASLSNSIILMIFIIILYFNELLTVKSIVIAMIGSLILSNIIGFIYTRKEGYRFNSFSKNYAKDALSYGLKSHLSNIIAFVNYRADIFLLNLLSSPISVGLYYVAVQIVERLWIVSSAVSTVLFPRFVALHEKDKERLSLISKTFRMVVILTIILSILLVMFGYYFIDILFGYEYVDAYYAILYLIPGVIMGAGSRILANAIAAKGRPELNAYTSIFVMILNIILNIIFIPNYGFIGASIATSIAYSINTILRIYIFSRLEGSFKIKTLIFNKSDFLYIKSKISESVF
jgi:O-antigen/teichoic acid export membrane protein